MCVYGIKYLRFVIILTLNININFVCCKLITKKKMAQSVEVKFTNKIILEFSWL